MRIAIPIMEYPTGSLTIFGETSRLLRQAIASNAENLSAKS